MIEIDKKKIMWKFSKDNKKMMKWDCEGKGTSLDF